MNDVAELNDAAGHRATLSCRRVFAFMLAVAWSSSAIVAFVSVAPLRATAGLLLVFVLPGALGSYALLPCDSGIDGRLRAVLIVALSVVVALVVGLILTLVSDGVSRTASATGVGIVATASGVISVARHPASATISLPHPPRVALPVAIVTTALLVGCVALVVAALAVNSLPGEFTALSLTREGDQAAVEIANHEGEASRYSYVITSGDGSVLTSGRRTVANGHTEVFSVLLAPGLGSLTVDVYRDSVLYRSATLRVTGH